MFMYKFTNKKIYLEDRYVIPFLKIPLLSGQLGEHHYFFEGYLITIPNIHVNHQHKVGSHPQYIYLRKE